MKRPATIYGVDFSGAAKAGKNIWIAKTTFTPDHLRLDSIACLETLSGTADREPALAYLVRLIQSSSNALWAMDFPFALPIELFETPVSLASQLQHVFQWPTGAQELGRWCVARAKTLAREMHIRRETDKLAKTPFDCYHYRIIYQTFHGMRDVLLPLTPDPRTAILPFQYAKLAKAARIIVEACPSTTLKRLKLPHQNYKQPAGGPLTAKRRQTRHTILAALKPLIDLTPEQTRILMRNPGGDAIDAVLAAVGAAHAWQNTNHHQIKSHPRHPIEGYVYA